MMKTWLVCRAICTLLGLSTLVACEDDDESTHEEVGDPDPTCEAISTACHDVEDLSARAHECHDFAHENDKSICEREEGDCVEHCAALDGAGGAGGHGGAHD